MRHTIAYVVLYSSRSKPARHASTNRKSSGIAVLRLSSERQCSRQGGAQNWRLPAGSLFYSFMLLFTINRPYTYRPTVLRNVVNEFSVEAITFASITIQGANHLSVSVCRHICHTLQTLYQNKKLSYCWETARHESLPKIAEMDVEMTT